MIESIIAGAIAGGVVAALFVLDSRAARRRARHDQLPPLTGHGWRGDDGD